MFSQIFQNIICSLQFYGHLSLSLLDFLVADICRAIIRNCRRFNDNILFITDRSHCFIHILCSHNRYQIYKHWRLDSSASTHQRNICATKHGSFRNCVSHFSGRMIRDISHRVNCFLCGTRCYQNFFTLQIFFTGNFSFNISKQCLRFRHLARTCITTCQISACRCNHFISIMLQNLKVILYNRVFKHICIHGW